MGGKLLRTSLVSLQNGTAVLEGLIELTHPEQGADRKRSLQVEITISSIFEVQKGYKQGFQALDACSRSTLFLFLLTFRDTF